MRSIVAAIPCIGILAASSWFGASAAGVEGDRYVGSSRCAECHAESYAGWRGSHHERAMAEASEDSVLGDFGDVSVSFAGITSTFYRGEDGSYLVRTDGPDGALERFHISHTFGWYPLQQYLIPFPDGRLQALGIAWDTRPADEGGQRWFHLYPQGPPAAGDPLHWTGPDQTWNYMCADCHSTDLGKRYDPTTDSYDTRWSEINVACEACHGPGSDHLEWVRAGGQGANNGLPVHFDERQDISWRTDPGTGLPRRSRPRTTSKEIDTCAPCHSRRSTIAADPQARQPLMDSHLPALLRPGLYHADGQILDEVYVYGSFLQSRMYRAGVTCSDCHDPHSTELRAPGAAVCLQCHEARRFATTEHHHHPAESVGADCLGCHMPERTYMVVDPRRDHSFRIPRPDLTLRMGTPNACAGCHQDLEIEVLDQQVRVWYGEAGIRRPSFAPALQAGREGRLQAPALLAALANDRRQPAIARATALEALAAYPGPRLASALGPAAADKDPLVRGAVAGALSALPLAVRAQLGLALLDDPVLGVRIQAIDSLIPLLDQPVPNPLREKLQAVGEEFVAAQRVNSERPEARTNLGGYYGELGNTAAAEVEYRAALALDPHFVPAYVGLADLYRSTGGEANAVAILRQGLDQVPGDPSLQHALGLALVRAGERKQALDHLEAAAEGAPEQTRFAYVYAVALHDSGDPARAIIVLEAAARRRPADAEILQALVLYLQGLGRPAQARRYARDLEQLFPGDPGVARLLRSLEQS